MKYEPIINTAQLLDNLASLPVAIRITPLDDIGNKWAWQVLEESGITEDINTAINMSLQSLTAQLLISTPKEP